jgi:hypothetical protein
MTVKTSNALCFSTNPGTFSNRIAIWRRKDTIVANSYDQKDRSETVRKLIYSVVFAGTTQ